MTITTHTEHLAIDGLPLSTPAWSTDDIAELLNGPGVRGADLVVPHRPGQLARRRTIDARTVAIPVTVTGYTDPDGVPYTDPRAGLLTNLDILKAALRPTFSGDGTRTLTWTHPAGTRVAAVHLDPALDVAMIGPHAARIVITATVPAGVLRAATATVQTIELNGSQNSKVAAVTFPGTGDIADATITVVTGAVQSVRIRNLTADPSGGVYLFYPDSHDGTLSVDCGAYTAAKGTTDLSGKIVNGGSALWLPLLAGTNELHVELPGNTTPATVTVSAAAVWL